MINRRTVSKDVLGLATACAMLMAATISSAAADKVTIFAAASLKTALDAVNAAWTADTAKQAVSSYAASSALAKQIEDGAPADIFISADLDWMDRLSAAHLIRDGSVVQLLGNDIVLIAPQDSKLSDVNIQTGFDLSTLVGDGKLAMGEIKSVPAGKYGKAALENLGVWRAIENKVAMAENVRATLRLVSTGEAALGVVYATDAQSDQSVKVIGTFPAASHPAIIYPIGIVTASKNPDASAYVKYLQGPKAQSLFKRQGFTVLVRAAQ